MRIDVITLFPEPFRLSVGYGVVGKAIERGVLDLHTWNPRDQADDRWGTVDDRPFGGGPGMVIKPEPVFAAMEALDARFSREDGAPRGGLAATPKILFTPTGAPLTQERAAWLAAQPRWLGLCGRYEGFDERIHAGFDWVELSVGDFVLSGGELAAMVAVEAAARLLPGVLGHEESAAQDSFGAEGLLDHPHYTRPRDFRGHQVPEVLLSGNHEEISAWRRAQAENRTAVWKALREDQR